jgi:hypothetical protein
MIWCVHLESRRALYWETMDTISALWKSKDSEADGKGGRSQLSSGWRSERAANGSSWYVDACKELVNWAAVNGSWEEMGPWARISNMRTQYPSTFANGTYFSNLGSARWWLLEKRTLGVWAVIMTWCPLDVVVVQNRKWCGEGGTVTTS